MSPSISVCLSVSWSFGLPFYGVGEAGRDMVSLPSVQRGNAADSRFYLMWTSRVGFQRWLQHMISIMTRAGKHAGVGLAKPGREKRGTEGWSDLPVEGGTIRWRGSSLGGSGTSRGGEK